MGERAPHAERLPSENEVRRSGDHPLVAYTQRDPVFDGRKAARTKMTKSSGDVSRFLPTCLLEPWPANWAAPGSNDVVAVSAAVLERNPDERVSTFFSAALVARTPREGHQLVALLPEFQRARVHLLFFDDQRFNLVLALPRAPSCASAAVCSRCWSCSQSATSSMGAPGAGACAGMSSKGPRPPKSICSIPKCLRETLPEASAFEFGQNG